MLSYFWVARVRQPTNAIKTFGLSRKLNIFAVLTFWTQLRVSAKPPFWYGVFSEIKKKNVISTDVPRRVSRPPNENGPTSVHPPGRRSEEGYI